MVAVMTLAARTALSAAISFLVILFLAAPVSAIPSAPQGGALGGESTASDQVPGDEAPAGAGGLEETKEKLKAEVDGLLADPVGTLKRWVLEDGPRILWRVLLFFVLLAVSRIVAGFAGRVVRQALDRSAKDATELLKTFVQNTVTKIVFFIGVVLALQNIGLDIAPLLAGIGVVGFVVGFALQDTLSNFAAGIMLLMYRPFDVGDFVDVAGHEGTVDSMTLVSTTLLTPDNQRLTIPNGKIWGDVIRNVTANETRRMNETVGVGYEDDIARVEEVAMEVVKSIDTVLPDPEPQVVLVGLGDSSVNFSVRAWAETGDYFATCCEFRRRIKLRFDEEGISIPYPQRDVHLVGAAPPESGRVAERAAAH